MGRFVDLSGYAIFRPNNLEFHLGCHTCWLTYFTLVCLWCGQTVSCSVGRCTVTWLPNFLGWVDLLSYGAPLRTELIYTFRDGLNFGEGILNIQVATTALIQVSMYFSDAQITKFSYPRCTAARARALPKMFVVNQDVQNAKIDLCHAAAILSQEI